MKNKYAITKRKLRHYNNLTFPDLQIDKESDNIMQCNSITFGREGKCHTQ